MTCPEFKKEEKDKRRKAKERLKLAFNRLTLFIIAISALIILRQYHSTSYFLQYLLFCLLVIHYLWSFSISTNCLTKIYNITSSIIIPILFLQIGTTIHIIREEILHFLIVTFHYILFLLPPLLFITVLAAFLIRDVYPKIDSFMEKYVNSRKDTFFLSCICSIGALVWLLCFPSSPNNCIFWSKFDCSPYLWLGLTIWRFEVLYLFTVFFAACCSNIYSVLVE